RFQCAWIPDVCSSDLLMHAMIRTGGSAIMLAERAPLGKLVGEHDGGAADADHGVHELAAGAGQPALFHGAERLLVELDRVRRAGDDQMRRDGVHSVGDGFYFRHCCLLMGKGIPTPGRSAALEFDSPTRLSLPRR